MNYKIYICLPLRESNTNVSEYCLNDIWNHLEYAVDI